MSTIRLTIEAPVPRWSGGRFAGLRKIEQIGNDRAHLREVERSDILGARRRRVDDAGGADDSAEMNLGGRGLGDLVAFEQHVAWNVAPDVARQRDYVDGPRLGAQHVVSRQHDRGSHEARLASLRHPEIDAHDVTRTASSPISSAAMSSQRRSSSLDSRASATPIRRARAQSAATC